MWRTLFPLLVRALHFPHQVSSLSFATVRLLLSGSSAEIRKYGMVGKRISKRAGGQRCLSDLGMGVIGLIFSIRHLSAHGPSCWYFPDWSWYFFSLVIWALARIIRLCRFCFGFARAHRSPVWSCFCFNGLFANATSRHPAGPVCSLIALYGVSLFNA